VQTVLRRISSGAGENFKRHEQLNKPKVISRNLRLTQGVKCLRKQHCLQFHQSLRMLADTCRTLKRTWKRAASWIRSWTSAGHSYVWTRVILFLSFLISHLHRFQRLPFTYMFATWKVFYSSVRSRKKKFDSNRADNSRTEKLDLFIGALRIVQANIWTKNVRSMFLHSHYNDIAEFLDGVDVLHLSPAFASVHVPGGLTSLSNVTETWIEKFQPVSTSIKNSW